MTTERAARITDRIEAQMVECTSEVPAEVSIESEIERLKTLVTLDEWMQAERVGRTAQLEELQAILRQR